MLVSDVSLVERSMTSTFQIRNAAVECPSLKRQRRACSTSLTLQARTRFFLRGALAFIFDGLA